MSLSTETFTTRYVTDTATTLVLVSPTFISSDVTITVTSHLASTITATYGQTVTVHPPSASASPSVPITTSTSSTPSSLLTVTSSLIPSDKYTPFQSTTTVTSTLVFTELDVYLQGAGGGIFSTWYIPVTPFLPSSPTGTLDPGTVYVVNQNNNGWNSWSKGDKAGLIVGVILGTFLLFGMLLFCCRKAWKGTWWFASGWPATHPQTMMFDNPAPALVQPTYVNGPVVPYGYPNTQGYGLRGGEGVRQNRRLFSGPNWFTAPRKQMDNEEPDMEAAEGSTQEERQQVARPANSRRKASGKNWFTAGGKGQGGVTDESSQIPRAEDKRARFYQPPRP